MFKRRSKDASFSIMATVDVRNVAIVLNEGAVLLAGDIAFAQQIDESIDVLWIVPTGEEYEESD